MTGKEVEITVKLSPATWQLVYGHMIESQARTGKTPTPDQVLSAVLYADAARRSESPKASKRMQDMLHRKVKEMVQGKKK